MTSPPGWYPDPDNEGQSLWWDGADWSSSPPAPPPSAPSESTPVAQASLPERRSRRGLVLMGALVFGAAVVLFAVLARGGTSAEVEFGLPSGVTIEEIYRPGPSDGDVVGVSSDGRGVVTRLDDRLCRRYLDLLDAPPDCIEDETISPFTIGLGAAVWATADGPLIVNRAMSARDPGVIDFDAGTVVDLDLDGSDEPTTVIPFDVEGDRVMVSVESDLFIVDLDGTNREFIDRLGNDGTDSGRFGGSAVVYAGRGGDVIRFADEEATELKVDFRVPALLDIDATGDRALIVDAEGRRTMQRDVLYIADFGSESVEPLALSGIGEDIFFVSGWLSDSGDVAWAVIVEGGDDEVVLHAIELGDDGASRGDWNELTRWSEGASPMSIVGAGLGEDGREVVYHSRNGVVYRLVPSYA